MQVQSKEHLFQETVVLRDSTKALVVITKRHSLETKQLLEDNQHRRESTKAHPELNEPHPLETKQLLEDNQHRRESTKAHPELNERHPLETKRLLEVTSHGRESTTALPDVRKARRCLDFRVGSLTTRDPWGRTPSQEGRVPSGEFDTERGAPFGRKCRLSSLRIRDAQVEA
jgi:hypothetical protein